MLPHPLSKNPTAAQRVPAFVITSPERVVLPANDITKQEVADYYRAAATWILPELEGRPVSVLRCPDG